MHIYITHVHRYTYCVLPTPKGYLQEAIVND